MRNAAMAIECLAAPTVGEIARRLGVPLHRVEYVIRSRAIRPSVRAGNLRVFTEADVQHIASELRRIAEDRSSLGSCQ
jgi:DNA-binding transcriptional MerR regulator